MWACPCVYTHETNVTSLQLRFTTVLPTTLAFLRGTSAPARCLVPARARSELRLHSTPLSSELGLVFLVVRRQARDRDEVDTVPVTFGVGQVVTQVRPVDRDRLAYVDNTRAHLHQGLARMAPSILHQRHKVPGAASRSGQPRPISLLGRAGRLYRAWSRHGGLAVAQHAHVGPDDLLVPVSEASGTVLCKLASLSVTSRPRLPQAPASLGQSAAGWAPLAGHIGLGFDMASYRKLGQPDRVRDRARERVRARVGVGVSGQGQWSGSGSGTACACDSLRKSSIERPRGATKSGLPVTES
eukprot:scaffold9334_cov63-Phaeocystis_antarctica.AAC.2